MPARRALEHRVAVGNVDLAGDVLDALGVGNVLDDLGALGGRPLRERVVGRFLSGRLLVGVGAGGSATSVACSEGVAGSSSCVSLIPCPSPGPVRLMP